MAVDVDIDDRCGAVSIRQQTILKAFMSPTFL